MRCSEMLLRVFCRQQPGQVPQNHLRWSIVRTCDRSWLSLLVGHVSVAMLSATVKEAEWVIKKERERESKNEKTKHEAPRTDNKRHPTGKHCTRIRPDCHVSSSSTVVRSSRNSVGHYKTIESLADLPDGVDPLDEVAAPARLGFSAPSFIWFVTETGPFVRPMGTGVYASYRAICIDMAMRVVGFARTKRVIFALFRIQTAVPKLSAADSMPDSCHSRFPAIKGHLQNAA